MSFGKSKWFKSSKALPKSSKNWEKIEKKIVEILELINQYLENKTTDKLDGFIMKILALTDCGYNLKEDHNLENVIKYIIENLDKKTLKMFGISRRNLLKNLNTDLKNYSDFETQQKEKIQFFFDAFLKSEKHIDPKQFQKRILMIKKEFFAAIFLAAIIIIFRIISRFSKTNKISLPSLVSSRFDKSKISKPFSINESDKIEIKVSEHFEFVKKLYEITPKKSDLYRWTKKIISKEQKPWFFQLTDPQKNEFKNFFENVSESEKEKIREFLSEIKPNDGDKFDPNTMVRSKKDSKRERGTHFFVTSYRQPGYKIGGFVIEKAQVSVISVDWKILSEMKNEISKQIVKDPMTYLRMNEEQVKEWTVLDGVPPFSELQSEFSNEEPGGKIEKWARTFLTEINKAYQEKSKREKSKHQLFRPGNKGESFDPSTMKVEGEEPSGDAKVIKTLRFGLGCKGSTPLLFAIVEVEEEEL